MTGTRSTSVPAGAASSRSASRSGEPAGLRYTCLADGIVTLPAESFITGRPSYATSL
jgi:hypothetical protein